MVAQRRLDPLTQQERSERMGRVKARGNKSTELAVIAALRQNSVHGWRRHANLPGTPDFYFAGSRLAIFVHGCFWHGCSTCGRMPKTRTHFWAEKIQGNRRRDVRSKRALRALGVHTLTIWEHELRASRWLRRVRNRLASLADGARSLGSLPANQRISP